MPLGAILVPLPLETRYVLIKPVSRHPNVEIWQSEIGPRQINVKAQPLPGIFMGLIDIFQ